MGFGKMISKLMQSLMKDKKFLNQLQNQHQWL
jgi:hypothetical protein